MKYEVSSGYHVFCGNCGNPIPAGMPVYRLERIRSVRCAACAATMGIDLPAPIVAPVPDQPAIFQRFKRDEIARKLKSNIRDFRKSQAGDAA